MKQGFNKEKTLQYLSTNLTSRKLAELIWSIIRFVLIAGISFILIYPLLIKISSSIMSLDDVLNPRVNWIPLNPTLSSYRMVFDLMNYPRALFNSILLSSMVSLLQLFSCTVVGYGFARFNFKGRKLWFFLVILTLVVPPQLLSIPMYLNFRFFNFFGMVDFSFNLLNSYWPFILLSITSIGYKNGLFIYIMRQYFKGMPRGLEEAAYVDGAGPIKTFYRVMLPGAIPALVIVFLFSFVWQWNDYFYTWTFLRDFPVLPIAYESLVEEFIEVEGSGSTQYISVINNTGAIMIITPLLVLYSFTQRFFIESVSRTGLVG